MAESETADSIGQSRRSKEAEVGGRELALLLGCLKIGRSEASDDAVRDLLAGTIDWTCFAGKITAHDLAVPVAEALLDIAPDLLPGDILDAFQTIADQPHSTGSSPSSNVSELPPEDELLMLAAKGANVSDWNLKWPYGMAGFIKSHPSLDWQSALKRARAQGCRRILVFGLVLAEECFGFAVPDAVASRQRIARHMRPIARRVVAHWQTNDTIEPDFRLEHKEQQRLSDRQVSVWRRVLMESQNLRAAVETSALGLLLLPRSPQQKSQLRRYRQACKSAREALARNPNDFAAWRNLGHAFFGLARYRDAIGAYDKALTFEPEHPTVWQNRFAALEALGSDDDGRTARPDTAGAWLIQASRFYHAQQFAKASEACDRALALDPKNVSAARLGIHCRLHSCDWSRRDEDKRAVTAGLNAGEFVIRTLDHRALADSEEENRLAARLVAAEFRNAGDPLWQGELYRHDKIRVAYLSTDFRTHAVASLIAGCFEHHDMSRFETIAVSLQPGDGSALRRRLEAAFGRFIHAQQMNDAAVAQLLRKLEIDIAVDLNGYTGRIRSGILARRPAAVQVSYLGFAGTMDAPFIDYVLADEVVLPAESKIHYREKIAYLPYSYMPSDNRRSIAESTPTRAEAGLPQSGFVFACLSYAHKISPEVFDTWMRLMRAINGSVLWLRSANAAAIANLRREAAVRGVAPDRLIFAPPVASEADYLARFRLADLFLDTLPYNAHATASDALWAGLPLLTCAGRSFHSRVAASLLYAAGLPELVTTSLAQYEDVARSLATDPARLAALRTRLVRSRETSPLFDTARMTRDLEAAYTAMWQRSQSGGAPESFTVRSGEPMPAAAVS